MADKQVESSRNKDCYAVVGNPISHSKSPLIHEAFAKQTQQNMSYERVLAPLDGFDATVRDLVAQGYKGLNVTVPFKFEAFQLSDELTARALSAGAVNTLIFSDKATIGDNTDGAGLVRDIEHNLHISIQGKRVLLIGAGGAAEGVLQPILACAPAVIVVTNRTLDKALGMVKKIEGHGGAKSVAVSACALEDLRDQAFDIVINATSTGLSDTALPIPATIFAENCLAYDMMYGRETPFMAQARAAGAQVADGLGMLVEQAAEAFYLWRGARPETKSVMAMVRAL